jgi:hypothetical protein
MASLLGKITAMIPAIGQALLHIRFLQRDLARNLTRGSKRWENPCPLSKEGWNELDWWLTETHKMNGLPIHMKDLTNMTPQATIFTDASDTGWGIKSEWVTTSGFWTPEEREESINVRELKTILFALQIHRRNATNTHIRLFTDSITALKFVKKHGGTSSLQLQELAIEIQQLITANNITIDFQHIPGKNNTIADRLSRRARPVYEWKLPKWWFRKIQRRWGRRILDAFAAHHNRQLPRYWSRLPDPQAEAIDAFAQQWPKKGLFLHPPWKLIPRVLEPCRYRK